MIQAILKALIASKEARRDAALKMVHDNFSWKVDVTMIEAEIASLKESLAKYDTE